MGIKKYILIICLICLFPVHSFADATINSGSCSNVNINTALSSASSSTGVVTVIIPPCLATTHTAALTVNMATGFANVSSLIIQGAGKTQTELVNSGWNITPSPTKKFRLTGIKFSGTTTSTQNGWINIMGTTSSATGGGYRIDNNDMNCTASCKRAINIIGPAYGLIDGNTSSWYGQWAIHTGNKESGLGGNTEWAADDDFGSANATYVENNALTNTDPAKIWFTIDNEAGAKIVLRYNNLVRYHFGGHDAVETHWRSTRSYEAYNNYFTTNDSYGESSFHLRGGTGYIYNNRTYASIASKQPYGYPSQILLRNKRSEANGDGNPWVNKCDNTNEKMCISGVYPQNCTTDANCGGGAGSCQQIDGNIDATGYPCRDQLGRGKDQVSRPILFWNNKTIFYDATETYTTPYVQSAAVDHIKNTRDYCFHNTTMPATCNGVATSYTAYTCPHPLADPLAQGLCVEATPGTAGYSLTDGEADTTAPTCIFAIDTTGLIATATCSEPVDAVTKTGLHFDGSVTGVITATYKDGMPGTNPRFDITEVQQSDIVTATYATPGTGIKDAAGNALADFTGAITFNGSTQQTPPVYHLTVTVSSNGKVGCIVTSSPSGINANALAGTNTLDVENGTTVTLGGFSINGGWNDTITYDCDSNGTNTVIMSADKTCTATCTEKHIMPW